MRSLLRSTALRSATRAPRALPACYAARPFSVKADHASASKQRALDPSKLQITKTKHPKALSKPEDLVFGKEFTGTPNWALTRLYTPFTDLISARPYAHD